MNNSLSRFVLVLPALSLLLAGSSARAVVESDFESTTSSSTFDGDILSNDLLTGLTPTGVYTTSGGTNPATGTPIAAGDTITKSDNGFTLTGFNDGSEDDNVPSNKTVLLANGQLGSSLLGTPQFTFSLNTSANVLGYSLSKITTINGFVGYSQQLSDQSYTVSFSTVLAPTVFTDLATVAYAPFPASGSPSSSEVQLTQLTQAVGVSAIRFTFTDAPGQPVNVNHGQLIRELDVTGTPTLAIPEPSTYAMLIAGLGLLVFALRFSKSRLA